MYQHCGPHNGLARFEHIYFAPYNIVSWLLAYHCYSFCFIKCDITVIMEMIIVRDNSKQNKIGKQKKNKRKKFEMSKNHNKLQLSEKYVILPCFPPPRPPLYVPQLLKVIVRSADLAPYVTAAHIPPNH